MPEFGEEELLPISGLQHFAFCQRQFALIHIEQTWEENRLTAEGRLLHHKVDQQGTESRGDCHIARSVRLCSRRHGLTGVADVIEFHRDNAGIEIGGKKGRWRPFPVEYKRGRPKRDNVDAVQLCAQALCLEEMLGTDIGEAALFYGKTRRRHRVAIDEKIRRETIELTTQMHLLWSSRATPRATYDKRCENCSLSRLCMPTIAEQPSVTVYLDSLFRDLA